MTLLIYLNFYRSKCYNIEILIMISRKYDKNNKKIINMRYNIGMT